MNNRISRIENDVQNMDSVAWRKLCEYIDIVAKSGEDEFSPREFLGDELFQEIHTLPESISKLKKVKKVWLYGSKLKRIPPEIGKMESLEEFDPYTSYELYWFPYELTNCKNLKNSRISTRVLYGNYKNRKGFPRLDKNQVRYFGNNVKCSACGKVMYYEETNQLWITLKIGSDVVPLLVNLCSKECENYLPTPPENYIQYAHKGGANLTQPLDEDEMFELGLSMGKTVNLSDSKEKVTKSFLPIKLIRKIWGK